MKAIWLALALVAYSPLSPGEKVEDQAPSPWQERSPRTVLTCEAADHAIIRLLAKPDAYNLDNLLIEVNGQIEPAFKGEPTSDATGEVVLAKCLHHTLLVVLKHGPPYMPGAAFRLRPGTHAVERVYFAEKSLPIRLYLSGKEMLVVIPNIGNETNKRYLIYRYVTGQGQPDESDASDQLPNAGAYEVMRIAK